MFDFTNRFNPYTPPGEIFRLTDDQETFRSYLLTVVERIFNAEPLLRVFTPFTITDRLIMDAEYVYFEIALLETSAQFQRKIVNLMTQIIMLCRRIDQIIITYACCLVPQ